MLLVCVWLLWNRNRKVGGTLFGLLVTGVTLGTGLRNTKPVCSPGEPLTQLLLTLSSLNFLLPLFVGATFPFLNKLNANMRKQLH
jgi:hypothetical protein